MKSYEGYCRGGPWDGKQYAHTQSTFTILTAPAFPRIGSRVNDDDVIEPVISGEYRHVAGQWVWHKIEIH